MVVWFEVSISQKTGLKVYHSSLNFKTYHYLTKFKRNTYNINRGTTSTMANA